MTKMGLFSIIVAIAALLLGLVISVSDAGQELRNIKFEILSLSVLGIGTLFTTLSIFRLLRH